MEGGQRISRIILAIGLLSAATLCFETALTRFLAVAQFYHFAFLIVSLALLGFGASGTLISLFPQLKRIPLESLLIWVGILFSISIWLTYGVINWLPFDSYSIAWEKRQILFFILYYFSLSLPFLVSGLGFGITLAVIQKKHNLIYAANLIGSGLGVLFASSLISLAGILGVILISGLLGLGTWMIIKADHIKTNLSRALFLIISLVGILAFVYLTISNINGKSAVGIKISPYKGLSYARLYPGSELIFGKWRAASRVDVLADAGTRRMPGLSYLYTGLLPSQYGLSVDGDVLQPITLTGPNQFPAGEWLPEWWALTRTQSPDVLVVNPGAGFGILQAASAQANSIYTIIEDRLVVDGVNATASDFSMFLHPDVEVFIGNPRAYLESEKKQFDLVYLPLVDSYQPVTNGAYSITENYSLTTAGIKAAIQRLDPEGIFLSSRWLQNPPSEGLRLITISLTALEELGIEDLSDKIVIYRGIQTMTLVIKPAGWKDSDMVSLRDFLERCHFDLVWAPDLELNEINRWNKLPEPIYYQAVLELFQAVEKEEYYQSYLFNVKPSTDNQPFFFHFFTWSQTTDILETLGKTWQPFGGSGFLLLFFLLTLVILLSGLIIILPLIFKRRSQSPLESAGKGRILIYFGLIGAGFMFLEIPLISQWRLFLDSPIASFSLVVGGLLIFSGLGSMAVGQQWIRKDRWFIFLVILGIVFIIFSVLGKHLILSWPRWIRYLVPCLGLAPMGFIMGTFFPRGITWIKTTHSELVPWAWAINGSISVISSVVTAILSLQVGFSLVLILGGLVYCLAWLIFKAWFNRVPQ